MDGETLQQWLSAFLDGELSGPDRAQLEAVLRADPRCCRQLAELATVKGLLGRLPIVPAPATVLPAVRAALPATAVPSADSLSSGAFLQALLTEPELLINAYSDHELSAEQRRHVETQLLVQPEHQQWLRDITQLAAGLGALLPEAAPPNVLAQVTAALAADQPKSADPDLQAPRPAADRSSPRVGADPGRQRRKRRVAAWLLSAYLDDELTDAERRLVERKLARSPRWRRWLRQQKKLQRWLAGLPRLAADPDCVEPVVAEIAGGTSEPSARPAVPPNGVAPVPAMEPAAGELRHESVVWAFRATSALALAASIVLFIGFVQLFAHYGRMKATRPTDIVSRPPVPAEESPLPTVAADRSRPTAPPLDVFGSLHAGWHQRTRIAMTPEAAVARAPGHEALEPMVLSFEEVKKMRPGDVVTTLDGKQLNFVCVDVKRVYDHLRIVLKRNQISLVDPVAAGAGSGRDDSPLYVVDISATPDQVRGMLADLPHEEAGRALISQVDIGDPDEELLTSMRNAVAPARTPDHPLVEEIRPPEELARWIGTSTARGVRLRSERSAAASHEPPAKSPEPSAAGATSKSKASQKAAVAKPPAGSTSSAAQTTAHDPAVPTTPNQQVRLLLVLEPSAAGSAGDR